MDFSNFSPLSLTTNTQEFLSRCKKVREQNVNFQLLKMSIYRNFQCSFRQDFISFERDVAVNKTRISNWAIFLLARVLFEHTSFLFKHDHYWIKRSFIILCQREKFLSLNFSTLYLVLTIFTVIANLNIVPYIWY